MHDFTLPGAETQPAKSEGIRIAPFLSDAQRDVARGDDRR
jgi:hypothetical protein